jgi:hypothetical protein
MSATISLDVLDRIDVASPCLARWEDMRGDDRVRFCSECRLHVYDLSAMNREEAAALVSGVEFRLCIRFYRRADGTMLTRDCPVGLRALRRRACVGLARIGAAAAFLLGSAISLGAARFPGNVRLREVRPFAAICKWLSPRGGAAAPVLPAPSLSSYVLGVRISRPQSSTPCLGEREQEAERHKMRTAGSLLNTR